MNFGSSSKGFNDASLMLFLKAPRSIVPRSISHIAKAAKLLILFVCWFYYSSSTLVVVEVFLTTSTGVDGVLGLWLKLRAGHPIWGLSPPETAKQHQHRDS